MEEDGGGMVMAKGGYIAMGEAESSLVPKQKGVPGPAYYNSG